MHRVVGCCAAIPLLAACLVAQERSPVGKQGVSYEKDIRPILARSCHSCHGPGRQMAGLRLDDTSALKGSHAGAVIEPGNADASKLILRVTSTKPGFAMPPAGPKLSSDEVALLKAWINNGAQMPAVLSKAEPVRSTHWAFQPVTRPQPPAVRNSAAVRNPIDNFVLARLEKEQLEPSPQASKHTLIRRLALDLTGLPPTPKEVDEFVSDTRPDAYSRLVDRLFASPHYGERWARHWLDLARYADSDGYEKDLVRPYAWRYRHWVINAFNSGMPYDQFSIEQIAGDLLPNATIEQRTATGFHRNVLTNREAGVDRAEARFEQDVNRTNTVSTVFLGLTAGCAQCHNHKYDPISHKEYYQLFAYSRDVEESDIEAPLPGELGGFLKTRADYEKERDSILRDHNILPMQMEFEKKLRQAVENPGADVEWDFMVTEFKARVDNAVKILLIAPEKRTRIQKERMTENYLRYVGPASKTGEEQKKNAREAREKLAKLTEKYPPLTHAMTVVSDSGAPKAYIALGGDYRAKGLEVEPGVPAVVGGGTTALKDRLSFARWLFVKENPLTARVAVNRFWGEFFGRGIVRTTEDFGTQGEKPTHPELLDWLASEFRDSGWDIRKLHKIIVMSATYQQSSNIRPDLKSVDPENTLLARQSRLRLPAELIRDAALASSGLLNTAVGGRSVRPPQPAGVAELTYANNSKWAEDKGPERYRRGLYIHFQRTAPYPMLMNFDAPDSNVACTRRSRSNTALQALNLLNDPVFLEAAQALAYRVLTEGAGPAASRLDYAFRLTLGRKPSQLELQRLSTHLDEQIGSMRRQPEAIATLAPVVIDGIDRAEAAAWVGVSRVLLNVDEFITRE